MQVGLLGLRVFFGLVLASHGAQKLFGWFGATGLRGPQRRSKRWGFSRGGPLR